MKVLSSDLEKMTSDELRTLADQLRSEYEKWKSEHPDSQQEDTINTFILIKRELKKRGAFLQTRGTTLDVEARAFEEIAKIKPVPLIPEEHVFSETCIFCDAKPEFLVISSESEGEVCYSSCAEHLDKVLDFLPGPVSKIEKWQSYAPVLPSGKKEGEPLNLKEIAEKIQDFLVGSPMVWLVGGIVERPSTEGDVDILISIPEDLEQIIEFRISRMFPSKIRPRLHFLCENQRPSPFTDNLPLFRLKMERIPDAKIQRMSEEEWAEVRLRTKGTEKQKAQAEKAIKNNEITPGEFYLHSKPIRGYHANKRQSIDLFLDIYDKHYTYPALSSKKYDGECIEIHRLKDRVVIYSEDGSILNRLLNLKKELKALSPETFVLEAELERWDYGSGLHYPRETVNTNEMNDQFTANVFDILYFKGSIPDKLFEEIECYQKEGKEKWKEKYL